MNDTDMELQAIRQKLQSLKAGPPPTETLAIPWSPPRTVTPTVGTLGSNRTPNQAQVTAAIEALKQRSNQSGYPDTIAPSSSASMQAVLAQELQRFQAQISKINGLAQQQATTILGLKQLAEEIEQTLHAYGIDSHPDLDPIANFFADHDAASILIVETDRHGNYCLDYQTVDFYQAERDAVATAQALRERTLPFSTLTQTLSNGPATASFVDELLDFCRDLSRKISRIVGQRLTKDQSPSRNRRSRSKFTFFDAAIWFSGAAIIRVLLSVIFDLYPALWTPIVVGLIVLVAIALYRTVLTTRPSIGLSYRILIMLAGLFVGGQFL